MMWMDKEEEALKKITNLIFDTLNKFVEKDLTRSKMVLENLNKLINGDQENFDQ